MDALRDYLKKDLGVSDEQYESLVSEARKTSPTVDLNNLAQVVAILMDKVMVLEGKVNA